MNGLVLFLGVIVMMVVLLAAVRVVEVWLSRRAPSARTHRTRESLARAAARSAHEGPCTADPVPPKRAAFRDLSRRLPLGAVLVVTTALIIAAVASRGAPNRAVSKTDGEIQMFERLPQTHVEGKVGYEPDPPVGGPHWRVWQNCGFYSEPVSREAAVHSLEHGAVWITYRPDLPEGQVEALRQAFSADPFVLMSPFPGLDRPIIASAWGRQLSLPSTTDPRLREFVNIFQQGPQRPEVGALCTGGAGGPRLP